MPNWHAELACHSDMPQWQAKMAGVYFCLLKHNKNTRLPFWPAIVACHYGMPVRHASSACHCGMSVRHVIVACHCGMSLWQAIVACHCGMSTWQAIVAVQRGNRACQCGMPNYFRPFWQAILADPIFGMPFWQLYYFWESFFYFFGLFGRPFWQTPFLGCHFGSMGRFHLCSD